MTTTTLSQDTLRKLALMQHLGEEFFILDGIAYEGSEEEQRAIFKAFHQENETDKTQTFEEWCKNPLSDCIEVEEYDTDDYNNDYLVLTDSEADDKSKGYILNSLWAFTPSFLSERTELDSEVFEAIQSNGKCEDNNDTIYNLVQKLDSIEDFVSAAISADGRGHFMNSYDGNENEETVNGETFYIYRIN